MSETPPSSPPATDPNAPRPARPLAPGSVPPPYTPPPRQPSESNSRPIIIAVLYLANLFVPFSALVGVVLAYVWRKEEGTPEWERSHFTYQIHTFWISTLVVVTGVVIMIFGTVAMMAAQGSNSDAAGLAVGGLFMVMVLVWIADAGWFVARCILSLMKASNREAMARPRTWLF